MNKKIAERADKNVSKFQENEKKVLQIVKNFDFKKIEEEHKELGLKIGNCYLSTLNLFEAMKEGDCMCLALDVVRSQAAIADPSKVVIKQIIPNFMTACSFIEAASFVVGNNPEATGGFDKNADRTMIVGANRENITGCIPLFLFKEHFKLARIHQEKIFGFLCALDPLGFEPKQLYVIPFLVLHRAFVDHMNDQESQIKRDIFGLMLESCQNVFINTNENKRLDEEIQAIFDFVHDINKRTVDQVPSIPLIFAKFLTFQSQSEELRNPEFILRFFQIAIEEIDRRSYGKEESMSTFNQIMTKIYPEFDTLIPNAVSQLEENKDQSIEGQVQRNIEMFEKLSIEEKSDVKPKKEVKRDNMAQKKISEVNVKIEQVITLIEER